MSGLARSVLIAAGVSLLTFFCLCGWYWLQLKQPSDTTLRNLQRVIPIATRLIASHQESQASALLERLPLKVVVVDSGRQPLASNLGGSVEQWRAAGSRAIQSGALPSVLLSEDGSLSFYYALEPEWRDPRLLFPLVFAILLGFMVGLWDFLLGRGQLDQTEALLLLSHLPGVAHPHAAETDDSAERLALLEQKNRALQTALAEARRWVLAAPDEDVRQLQQQLRRSELLLSERERQERQHQQAEQRLQEQQLELEAQARSWERQALEQTAETRRLRQAGQAQEAEITRLHQDAQRDRRDLEAARERLHALGLQSAQLHEAWQEIAALRAGQLELLQREEAWQKEKSRVLGLLHDKQQTLEQLRSQLQTSRQKIHALSLAYKKQLEMSTHLPADLADARRVIESLIEEKDFVEHDNVELNIALADKSSEVARLRKELEVRAQKLEEAQRLLSDLSQELQQHERELGLLSETLTDKLSDLDRLRDLHDEKAQVLEVTTQERDALRLQLTDLQTELEVLREEKALLLAARDQLERQLESIDVAAYQLEIDQLRQSLQLTGQQMQRRSRSVEELKNRLKEGEALYSRLKRHSDQQQQDIRRLHQEINMYQSELHLLEAKLAEQERAGLLLDEGFRV